MLRSMQPMLGGAVESEDQIYDDRVWGGGSGGSDPNVARPCLNFLQNS